MSAIQEQTKSLKLNATNIKSVLVRKNKRLKNLRKIKSRIVDVNVRQAKQAKVSAKMGGGTSGGGIGLPSFDIMGMVGKFLSGMFKLIGLLFVGLLINNLPKIVDTAKTAWKTVKPIVTLVWNIMRTIGRTMWSFGKWVVQLFVPARAKMDIDNIEEGNKELSAEVSGLMEEDDNLDGGSDEGGDEEPDSGTKETSDNATNTDIKPAATSTSPPSTSKRDEVSKDGTGDKLVKEKPLPKEETKTKKSKTEEKSKEQWTIVGVNENGFVEQNAAGETRTRMPKGKLGKRKWKEKLERQKNTTYVINGNEVSAKKATKFTTKATIELIETGRLKYFKDGKDITPVLKTTNTESLGKATPNTPTVIVMPIKETKVKTVSAGGGSSGGSIGESSTSSSQSNLRKNII
jgi:hypothetical protein